MKEMEQAEIEEIGNASTLVRWGYYMWRFDPYGYPGGHDPVITDIELDE